MLPIIQQLKENKQLDNACKKYMRFAEKCQSRKQLADVVFDINAIEYLAGVLAKGQIDIATFEKELHPFINGKYIYENEGRYRSAIYIGQERVEITTTCALIINCKTIVVPLPVFCELHIIGGDFHMTGDGLARVYTHHPDGTTLYTQYGEI